MAADSMAERGRGDLQRQDSPGLLIQGLVREGPEVRVVQVYGSYTRGFAGIQVLGDLSAVCRSGRERARAALENAGMNLGSRKLVIGFTPAGVPIDGAQMDLPLAIAMAVAGDAPVTLAALPGDGGPVAFAFAAEVGLRGELRPVPDMVALALGAARGGCTCLVIAPGNVDDLSGLELGGLRVLAFPTLDAVLGWLGGDGCVPLALSSDACESAHERSATKVVDGDALFDDMEMTPALALAAMVVGAGRHSILLRGTPGSGKTMFAQRLTGIMEPVAGRDRLQAMHLHNLAGNSVAAIRGGAVPFRSPHHGASMAAILGGHRSPGEISLAHGGILFLDELPEFRRDLLEALREPLESGFVHLARVQGHVVWPADAVLVAASNNCPCGWYGSRVRGCDCGSGQVGAYQARMSGPLLDRIDLHVNMPERSVLSSSPSTGTEVAGKKTWSTAELRDRVQRARRFARVRNESLGIDSGISNARLPDRLVKQSLGIEAPDPVAALVDQVMCRGGEDRAGQGAIESCRTISGRGLIRSLRVARTLADLDTEVTVGYEHFRQALLWQAGAASQERGDLRRSWPAERRSTWQHSRLTNGKAPDH